MRPPTDNNGWRLGLFGGWLNSGMSFSSYGASANYEGGTVGGYAAYLNGPLHLDAELKADFLSVDYSSPSVSASTTGTTVGVRTNAAWRVQKGSLYYEPIVSFAYANASLNNTSGGAVTINYSDGQSIRAGIGGRIGTTLGHPGGKKVDLDVMAKLWDEFGSPNTVTVSDGVTTQSFTDSISGLFGEVSARATVYSADRMWSGFAEANGTFSSECDLGRRQGRGPPELLRRPQEELASGAVCLRPPRLLSWGRAGMCALPTLTCSGSTEAACESGSRKVSDQDYGPGNRVPSRLRPEDQQPPYQRPRPVDPDEPYDDAPPARRRSASGAAPRQREPRRQGRALITVLLTIIAVLVLVAIGLIGAIALGAFGDKSAPVASVAQPGPVTGQAPPNAPAAAKDRGHQAAGLR